MSVPDWLLSHLPTAAQHPGLAICTVGDARGYQRGGLGLTSPAFKAGEELDPCFTADEEDAVAPPLEWVSPPPGTQELVVIVEDATDKSAKPKCHWLVWGLAGQRGKLLEGEAPPRSGKNSLGDSKWLLPELPVGETHTFVFQLFALDLPLTLMPGASLAKLIAEVDGHVMASTTLVAQYTRSLEDEGDWEDDEND